MKVYIPKDEVYRALITNLRQVHNIDEREQVWEIAAENDVVIPREWSGLSRRAFRRLGYRIQVVEGVKRVTDDEVSIQVLRGRTLKVRVTPREEKVLAEAAKLMGKRIAEFVRETAVMRATRILDKAHGSKDEDVR